MEVFGRRFWGLVNSFIGLVRSFGGLVRSFLGLVKSFIGSGQEFLLVGLKFHGPVKSLLVLSLVFKSCHKLLGSVQ